MNEQVVKIAWIVLGSLSVAVALVGIVLPVLPTTPFLLLAAACYIRGSQRLYELLLRSKVLGPYISNYREGRGMTIGAKMVTLSLMWGAILYSLVMVTDDLWVRLLLLLIAVGVSVHIVSLKRVVPLRGDGPL